MREESIKILLGKIITSFSIAEDKSEIRISTSDGGIYYMRHEQDCCESVLVDDIEGNTNDLIGSPLLQAEEITNSEGDLPNQYSESWTWTFYKFATVNGYVTIKWLGESNGYYSESVDFLSLKD